MSSLHIQHTRLPKFILLFLKSSSFFNNVFIASLSKSLFSVLIPIFEDSYNSSMDSSNCKLHKNTQHILGLNNKFLLYRVSEFQWGLFCPNFFMKSTHHTNLILQRKCDIVSPFKQNGIFSSIIFNTIRDGNYIIKLCLRFLN